MRYIGVKAICNTGGMGILEIDHTNDTVTFELVYGSRVVTETRGIITREDENGEYVQGFNYGGEFHHFGEFMRVGD